MIKTNGIFNQSCGILCEAATINVDQRKCPQFVAESEPRLVLSENYAEYIFVHLAN